MVMPPSPHRPVRKSASLGPREDCDQGGAVALVCPLACWVSALPILGQSACAGAGREPSPVSLVCTLVPLHSL